MAVAASRRRTSFDCNCIVVAHFRNVCQANTNAPNNHISCAFKFRFFRVSSRQTQNEFVAKKILTA